MRSFALIAALVAAAMAAPSALLDPRGKSGFTIGHPGGIKDVIVTKENTLNSTKRNDGQTKERFTLQKTQSIGGNLPLQFVNNFQGGQVNAYIQGIDSDGRVVFVTTNGRLVYPTANGSGVPVKINNADIAIPMPGKGQSFNMVMPITLTSGRIYFAEGELTFSVVSTGNGDGIVQPSVTNMQDPSTFINWGFVEFTYTNEKAVYANISYVDFVGLILSMSLSVSDGSGTQTTKGLQSNAVQNICNGLVDQSNRDGYPWPRMCIANQNGQPIRALSPNDYATISGDFNNYWQPYVDQVWQQYRSTPLVINTQTPTGNVNCRVNGDLMYCDGDNRPYAKPAANDIWGCNSGPFGKLDGDNGIHLAIIPRLCAAFTRSTLLIQGGNVQPSLPASSYYSVSPTSHFSRIVHDNEVDGRGYAFSYDDVNPDGENASGLVSSGNPSALTVYFGGFP